MAFAQTAERSSCRRGLRRFQMQRCAWIVKEKKRTSMLFNEQKEFDKGGKSMFRSIKELLGYQIMAKDGQIGKVEDLFFSDESWIVRYLVADTGPWIFGRKVLVSMQALGQPVWASQTFPVELTREQVENSPDADLAKPVSRQYEEKLFEHYRWQSYWAMSNVVPGRSFFIPTNLFRDPNEPVEEYDLETPLRSTREML
ncbi:MAG: PRC-barrel domain containing protein, partial [Anaerolineae bacterium]|nr:PRC-barrel domain containing protein [Anaerolineae bacterium]